MASVNSITLNGGSVSPFAGRVITVQGTQELHLLGTNLTSRDVQLVHDGVTYTPLQSTQEDFFFLLGSNGSNVIAVNGRWLCTIVVEGVVVPDGLPTRLQMRQTVEPVIGGASLGEFHVMTLASGECINYRYLVETSHPYFLLFLRGSDFLEEDFVLHNGVIRVQGLQSSDYRLSMEVLNASLPSYLTFKGFIVAVFNYSV